MIWSHLLHRLCADGDMVLLQVCLHDLVERRVTAIEPYVIDFVERHAIVFRIDLGLQEVVPDYDTKL